MSIAALTQLDGLRFLDHTYPEVIYPKRECRITFDFGAADPCPWPWLRRPLRTSNMRIVLSMLAPLVVFATVVFDFVPGQSELWEVEGTLKRKWGILQKSLERKIGPGKVIRGTDKEEEDDEEKNEEEEGDEEKDEENEEEEDDEKERMVFHPLDWSNNLARTQQIAEPWTHLRR